MSDVSKTNELIARTRHVVKYGAYGDAENLLTILADALEAATRVPVQGEPNDDREALARIFHPGYNSGGYDRTNCKPCEKAEKDADEILEAGFSRATVPDAAVAEGDQIINQAMKRVEVAEVERDAALAAIERVRAALDTAWVARREPQGPDSWYAGVVHARAQILAALDGAPEPERLSIPIPNVPFGPEGVAPTIATASYLIEVVKKIDFGYANVGGSNVTATLRKLLVDTAEALRGLPVEGESKP